MTTLALPKFVNLSLTAAAPGRWRVVERLADLKLPAPVLAVVLLVLMIGSLATPIMWISGAVSGRAASDVKIVNLEQSLSDLKQQLNGLVTQQDVLGLKNNIAALTVLVTQLQGDLRTVPRAADVIVLDRHLSAQDGRMDGIDTRLRDLESRSAALQARIDILDGSARANLKSR